MMCVRPAIMRHDVGEHRHLGHVVFQLAHHRAEQRIDPLVRHDVERHAIDPDLAALQRQALRRRPDRKRQPQSSFPHAFLPGSCPSIAPDGARRPPPAAKFRTAKNADLAQAAGGDPAQPPSASIHRELPMWRTTLINHPMHDHQVLGALTPAGREVRIVERDRRAAGRLAAAQQAPPLIPRRLPPRQRRRPSRRMAANSERAAILRDAPAP
jgi:hypothetical protein